MGKAQLDLFTGPAAIVDSGVAPAHVSAELEELAVALPSAVRFGTSSWSFPGWRGLVYADTHNASTLAAHGLSAYAKHPLLRAVGLDRTYYGPIDRGAFRAYAEVVPDDFRFLVKAHELCTIHRYPLHARYGSQRGQLNPYFLDAAYAGDAVVTPCVEGLKDKLGAILFQFSPQDVHALGGSPGFAPALKTFLSSLPPGPCYAVELRNAELFTPRYIHALADSGAMHCMNVHPTMPPVETQYRALDAFKDKPLVVRWLLADGMTYEGAKEAYEPFDAAKGIDPESRQALANIVARHAAGAMVIVNNQAEGSAPVSVAALAAAVVDHRRGAGET